MLTKELLRVSRAGGGYQPQFAGDDSEQLAARVIGCYQGHVGTSRGALQNALTVLERDAVDHKLVRGFAKLLEREATFAPRSPVPPERARKAVFEAAADVGVVTQSERQRALNAAASRLGTDPDAVDQSLHADRESRAVLVEISVPWTPNELVARYNCSLAQTALFDATEVRIRTDDPHALVTSVKRLGLLYEIERPNGADGPIGSSTAGSEVVVTGPDALFGPTRRYGTRFGALLEHLAQADSWSLTATVDDHGTERELRLSDDDPVAPPNVAGRDEFDSSVEADFATRFTSLDLDWSLVREPELLAAGGRAIVPDFAFDYRYANVRIFFEIMGFWTPEYVDKKLTAFETLEEVELIVAYDESLDAGENDAVGAAIDAASHRAIPYRGRVRVKDVRDALRPYEQELRAAASEQLPDQLTPDADIIGFDELADRHGVSERVLEAVETPEHRRVGRTLVRPTVLETLQMEITPGQSLAAAEDRVADAGIDSTSAVLSALGYRVEWDGLSGGTIVETE